MNAHHPTTTVHERHPAIGARLGVAAIALLIGACQSPATGSPPSSQIAAGSSLGVPSARPAIEPSAPPAGTTTDPAPSATPTTPPASTPAPPASTAWSAPVTVPGLSGCYAVVAAVDDGGRDHLAATCSHGNGSELRYADSTNGRDWTTATLQTPTGRYELDPQLALDGNKLYLAYTRVAPTDGGCGDDGLTDVGVYVRSRILPGGAWSDPKRIGAVADHLQSFRVSGSVFHATVTAGDGSSTTYETMTGDTLRRYPIGDAAGQTSLRVGDDGKGRIAYESAKGIAFGMVVGGRFASTTIPNSTNGWGPVLALAPGNDAYVVWIRSDHGGGCAGGEDHPEDGTWFATNANGTWVTSRLTPQLGQASLTIDPTTGGLSVVVATGQRLIRYDRAPGATIWAHETVIQGSASSPVVRANPKTGALFVAYTMEVNNLDADTSETHVEVVAQR